MKRLDGKVAVVTGGSSGIGLATAKGFHVEGTRTAIAGRTIQMLERAAEAIGEGVLCVRADVSKLPDIERLFRTLAERLGRIDVLFVNAGVGRVATILDLFRSVW